MTEEGTAPAGSPVTGTADRTLCLARWSSRFWAWLIDIIFIVLFLNIVRELFIAFLILPHLWDVWNPDLLAITVESIFFYAYWILLEGFRGQSIGKMVMNLRVVNRDGSRITYLTAAIESFPKAFLNVPFLVLLPLDCLIGWLAMPGSSRRVFNRISNTIVIRADYGKPSGILYVKEKE